MADFQNYSGVLAAAVANNATFAVSYTHGEDANTYNASAAGAQLLINGQELYVTPGGWTVSYGASSATITQKTGKTLPIGTTFTVQFVKPESNDIVPAGAVANITDNTTGTSSGTLAALAAITVLTDSSTGTSGGNTVGAVTDVATAANAVATLAAKTNALLAEYPDLKNAVASLAAKQNALLASLRSGGLLAP